MTCEEYRVAALTSPGADPAGHCEACREWARAAEALSLLRPADVAAPDMSAFWSRVDRRSAAWPRRAAAAAAALLIGLTGYAVGSMRSEPPPLSQDPAFLQLRQRVDEMHRLLVERDEDTVILARRLGRLVEVLDEHKLLPRPEENWPLAGAELRGGSR
jgi:hypothetical protein